jgi:hypothetical protein
MEPYKKVDEEIVRKLEEIVGKDSVLTDDYELVLLAGPPMGEIS